VLLVDDILFFPARSILWIFREIHDAAQKEMVSEEESITEQLRLLYMQLETDRISMQQFDAEEKLLLDRLDAIETRLGSAEEADEPETSAPDRETADT
jgi:hypothetical protein